jgi:hypothetical protein
MAHVSDHSKHHQVYTDFKYTGKCNYIKLPSQYLWDNTSLQKNFLLLFLVLQSLADCKPKTIAICVLGPATYISISLYLQIIVHAGLSPLFPSGFRSQKVFKIHILYGVGMSASCPTSNLEDQGIPFSLGHHLDLSDTGGPTSSVA